MTTGSSHWISRDERLALYLRDNFHCVYCMADLTLASPRAMGLDHLVPRTDGGEHKHSNLVTACHSCNSKKQNKPLATFCGEDQQMMARVLDAVAKPVNLELAQAIIRGDVSREEIELEGAE